MMTKLQFDKVSWTSVKFGDVVSEVRNTVKSGEKENIERYIGLEHIDSENIHITKWGYVKNGTTFTRKFDEGQILFGRRRAYLKKAGLATFTGLCSGDIIVMEAKEKLLPELLPFLINNNHFFDFAVDTSAGSLSPRTKFKHLAEYQFLLPPKDQQAKIAKLLWAMDDVVEKEKEVYTKIESLFLSVSKNVFSESAGEQKLLKEVSEVIMGQSPLGKTYNENGDGFAFLQGNAEFADRYPKNKKFTTSPKKIAPNNSILISVRAPVGDLNIANQDYCIGRGLAAIVVEDSNFREYIYNFLKYSEYELNKHSSGSTFKAINKDKLSTLKLVVPNNGNVQNSVGLFKRLSETMGKSKNQFNQSKQLQKTLINEIFSV